MRSQKPAVATFTLLNQRVRAILRFPVVLSFVNRLVILALAASGIWGQGRILGTITVADVPNRQFSLQTDQGELYAVKVLPEAKVQKIAPGQSDLTKAEPADIAALAKGDRILARGQQDATAKTILAAHVIVIPKQSLDSRDSARQQEWKAGSLAGIVKSTSPLTIQTRGNLAWTVDTASLKTIHQYADDSSKFANAKSAKLEDLHAGDQLRVLGKRDPEAKTVQAAEIVFGRFNTIGGEIKSIDADHQTLTVFDLSTKKNLTIQVSPEARMARLPGGGAFGGRPGGAGPGGQAGARAQGAPGGAGGPGGPGRPGGPGGAPGGGPDPAMLLERLPPAKFTDLQTGDAIVLTLGKANSPRPVALSLVAGLDFLLRAPAQQASQMIANWNMDGGLQ